MITTESDLEWVIETDPILESLAPASARLVAYVLYEAMRIAYLTSRIPLWSTFCNWPVVSMWLRALAIRQFLNVSNSSRRWNPGNSLLRQLTGTQFLTAVIFVDVSVILRSFTKVFELRLMDLENFHKEVSLRRLFW